MNSSASILVVEDDKDWREMLQNLLREQGYNVTSASSYGVALRNCKEISSDFPRSESEQNSEVIFLQVLSEFRKHRFNLVSLDLSLIPWDAVNRDGMTLLEDVIEENIPVIVVSGYATTEEKRHALQQSHVFYFFDKGNLETSEYVRVVAEALENRRRLASKKSILLIEDDLAWAKVVEEILSDEGYSCEVATSIAQAKAKFRETSFELAIIDLFMSGDPPVFPLGGIQVINWLVDIGANAKVIIWSAGCSVVKLPPRSEKVVSVIEKPNVEDLLKSIRDIIGGQ